MKKVVLLLGGCVVLAFVIALGIVHWQNRDVGTENLTVASPPIETQATPTDEPTSSEYSWEDALETFLGDFLTFFTSVEPMYDVDWDILGWQRFVKQIQDEFWYGYDEGYIFACPISGDRIRPGEVPFIRNETHDWGSESGVHIFPAIATGFSLYDIDGDGIPEVIIHWEDAIQLGSGDGGGIAEVFRYVNGRYVSVKEQWWHGFSVALFRDSQGRAISHVEVSGGDWLDFLSFDDNDMNIEPFIERYFQTDDGDIIPFNHVTGEMLSPPFPALNIHRDDNFNIIPNKPITVSGMPDDYVLTPIEPMTELQVELTQRITQRLQAEGLVR